jgi:2-polyprenyl-3-methyl-5-hydroxy-6-metoxy-1,4-benzoquinol methylase
VIEPFVSVKLIDLFYALKSSILFVRYRKSKLVRILDFGCGDTKYLRALARFSKFEVVGYDPFISREQINGVSFIKESDFLLQQPKFDLILVNHVLEHVVDLKETLKLLLSLKSNLGKIIGVTPNPNHWMLKVSRNKWGYLHYPQHLRIISKKGLRDILETMIDSNLEFITKNNVVNTCWAYTFEHYCKEFFRRKSKGHWRYDKFLLILFLPFNLIEKLWTSNLPSYTFEISLNEK